MFTIEELKRKIQLNTGFFETNAYTEATQMPTVSGNFDGAGLSVGNLQYNYGPADRAQEFFRYMVDNHLSVVQSAFGSDTTAYNKFLTVTKTYSRADRIAWADSITDRATDPDERTLYAPYETALGAIAASPEGIIKYNQMADYYYWPNSFDLFRQLNCKSLMALASLYDLNVNRGRFYPCNLLTVQFDNIDGNTTLTDEEKEAEKIKLINTRGNDPTNAMDSSAAYFVTRRDCFANQGGDYFGSLYDPDVQFDMTQEPAIKEKMDSILGVNLGEMLIENAYLGDTPIKSIYLGANLLSSEPTPYTTSKVPQTQFRTNSNSYKGIGSVTDITLEENQPLWIDVQNWVACRTYFTVDGSTPTENSILYTGPLRFTESATLKTVTISESGVAEPVKTLNVTIPVAATGYRYVRFIGYGDNTGITTRLIEFEALEGATNRLLNLSPMSGETPNGNSVTLVTNGSLTDGFAYWWTAAGVPDLIYDLGASYPIDTLRVVMSSPSTDPRATKFQLFVSNNATQWVQVIDYSQNTTIQPTTGFSFPVT